MTGRFPFPNPTEAMIQTGDWQALVRAAWDSIRSKVATQLPAALKGKQISNQSIRTTMGVCSMLNSPGNRSGSIWGSNGDGTMNLTSLTVDNFNDVTPGDAGFSGVNVSLPLKFSLIAVRGSYSYSQPCAFYSFGKKGRQTNVDGSGKLQEKREKGVLTYRLEAKEVQGQFRVDLVGATVDGARSLDISPNGQPDNAVLRWLVNYLGGAIREKWSLEMSLQTLFTNDQFSKDMVAELNKIIGDAVRAQGSRAVAGQ